MKIVNVYSFENCYILNSLVNVMVSFQKLTNVRYHLVYVLMDSASTPRGCSAVSVMWVCALL